LRLPRRPVLVPHRVGSTTTNKNKQTEGGSPLGSTTLRAELAGGIASAILTLPLSIGFGLFALSPLGERYAGYGVLAGLYSAIIVALIAVLLRANSPVVFAPRSMQAYLVSMVVLHLVQSESFALLQDPQQVLSVVFFVIFLSGIMQAAFGAVGLGSLVKYIPYPVIAGFQNAGAILLLLSQLAPMLGLSHRLEPGTLLEQLQHTQPLTLAIGVVTCSLMLYGGKLSKRIPAVITGMFAGIGLYYLFRYFGGGANLGPFIGEFEFTMPDLHYLSGFYAFVHERQWWGLLPSIFAWAASLALISSLDVLLCAKVMEGVTQQRQDHNLSLVRLGLGNLIAAAFGGISSAVSLTSSQANYNSGGRSSYSVLINSVLILVAVLFCAQLIALIPKVVVAGMLFVTAWRLFDRWTVQLLKRIVAAGPHNRASLMLDLFVIVLVTLVAVFASLVTAVAIGMLVSVFSFLFRMSKSVIRRSIGGDILRSRKTREPRLMQLLAEQGRRIVVFELEGAVFFGTAEKLIHQIEKAVKDGATLVIVDMKRVTDLDSTGVRFLVQANDAMVKQGKFLLLSSIEEHSRLGQFLRDMGAIAALTKGRVFVDNDQALEWAEDQLILSELGDVEFGAEFPFGQLDLFAGLGEAEIEVVKGLLSRRIYAKEEIVFREGDPGQQLFVIAKGEASVRIRPPGATRDIRLITFAPGTVFGEVALLDTEVRSASVQADEELVCYVLEQEVFQQLAASHPGIAVTLLRNLGRELSNRLRRANRVIYQLDN
jgi:MFS superfamily sulfate permease-like transporter